MLIEKEAGFLPLESERAIHRAGFRTAILFASLWFYGMVAVLGAVVVEWLLIVGQHWFGSGTWPDDGIVRSAIQGDWLDRLRGPVLLALIGLAGVLLSVERHPVTLAAWSVLCCGLHIVLIGAFF